MGDKLRGIKIFAAMGIGLLLLVLNFFLLIFSPSISALILGLIGISMILLCEAADWQSERHGEEFNPKPSCLVIFGAAVILLLGLGSFTMGFNRNQVDDRTLRIQFEGMRIVVPHGTAVKLGRDSESAAGIARWSALAPGANLELIPYVSNGAVESWTVNSRGLAGVLRLNNRVANPLIGSWIPNGNSGEYELTYSGQNNRREVFRFKLTVNSEEIELTRSNPEKIYKRKVVNRFSLKDPLNKILTDAERSSLFEGKFNAISDKFMIVRHVLGEQKSSVGLIQTESSPTSNYSLQSTTANNDGNTVITTGRQNATLEYDDEQINLPAKIESDEQVDTLTLTFKTADRYPLPEESRLGKSRNFVVTNVGWAPSLLAGRGENNVFDRPQYLFDMGRFGLQLGNFRLSEDKRHIEKIGFNNKVIKTYPANTPIALSETGTSPIFMLSDPVAKLSPPGKIAALAMLFGFAMVGFAFSCLKTRSDALLVLLPITVWILICGLFTIRAILSFRITVLPPADLAADSRKLFQNAWNQSLTMLSLFAFFGGLILSVVSISRGGQFRGRGRSRHSSLTQDLFRQIRGLNSGAFSWFEKLKEGIQSKPLGAGLLLLSSSCALLIFAASKNSDLRQSLYFFGNSSMLYAAILCFCAGLLFSISNSSEEPEYSTEGSLRGWPILPLFLVIFILIGLFGPILVGSLVGKIFGNDIGTEAARLVATFSAYVCLTASVVVAQTAVLFPVRLNTLKCFAILLGLVILIGKVRGILELNLAIPLAISIGIYVIGHKAWLIKNDNYQLLSTRLAECKSPKGLLLFGCIIVMADFGASIFAMGIIITVLVFNITRKDGSGKSRSKQTFVLSVILLIIGGLPFSNSLLSSPIVLSIFSKSGIAKSTYMPRIIANDSRATLDYSTNPENVANDIEPQKVLETLQQRWQMTESVRESGVGFFNARMPKSGMPQGIVPTDAAFSALITHEHGRFAGWLLVAFLVFIGFIFFEGARRHWVSGQRHLHRSLGLYLIGSLVAFLSTYMSLANLWKVPFTGQNLPFFGVGSTLDGLFWFVTAMIGLGMMLVNPEDSHVQRQRLRTGFAWWGTTPLMSVVWLGILGYSLFTESRKAEPFSLPDEVTAKLREVVNSIPPSQLREPNEENVDPKMLLNSPYFQSVSTPLFRFFAQNFALDNPITPLELDTASGKINVKASRLQLPVLQESKSIPWEGVLAGQYEEDSSNPRLVLDDGTIVELVDNGVSGRTINYTLGQGADVITGRRNGPQEISYSGRAIRASTVNFVRGRELYGGLAYREGSLKLNIQADGQSLQVLVDGISQPNRVSGQEIKELQVVSFRERRGGLSSGSGIFIGRKSQALSVSAWQNGSVRRLYPQRSDFPFAAAVSDAYAYEASNGRLKPKVDVTISPDMRLHKSLQSILRTWNQQNGRSVDRVVYTGDVLRFTALSVVDSFSGQVLAMPSLPTASPEDDPVEVINRMVKRNWAERAQFSNFNLSTSNIGSTVKPGIIASMAMGMEGSEVNPATFSINEGRGVGPADSEGKRPTVSIGNLTLSNPFKSGQTLAGWTDNQRLLSASRTQPSVFLGFLGLSRNAQGVIASTRRAGADISIGASRRAFDLDSIKQSVFPRGLVSPQNLDESLIIRGLEKLNAPYFRGTFESRRQASSLAEEFQNYLPKIGLSESFLSQKHYQLCPDLHDFDSTRIHDTGDLARYFFGGTVNRWSALLMATHMARLSTGKLIRPTFDPESANITEELPSPINTVDWRNRTLYAPLTHIGTIDNSYARFQQIRGIALRRGYDLMVKTGTIDSEGLQSELLMFTLGKRVGNDWQPGKTVSGFLTLVSSRESDSTSIRGGVLEEMVNPLLNHLERRGR